MPQVKSKSLALAVSIFVVSVILVELTIAFLFEAKPLGNYLYKLAFYVAAFLFWWLCWFVGIKVMHLDASGPVPWYASPVVWLAPVVIFTIILMMGFGG